MSLALMFQYLVSPEYVRGAMMTLLLTICSLFFGILVGLVIALVQEGGTRIGRIATLAYLWVFRGTPVLFQIIFIYNVLPSFGIRLSAFVSAVLALSLNEGAYMAEILRSGLQAVRKGQRVAGLALGMTGALVSVVAVEELLLVSNQIASANFRYFEALTAAGIWYLALTTAFMALQML